MTVTFDFAAEFFEQQGVPLSVDDLKYGFERGWLSASTVIRCAVEAVKRGDDDTDLLDIACLLSDQVDEVPDLLVRLELPGRVYDPRESARKWLYFVLVAAYDGRGKFANPLAVVEEIYADFDYPSAIESFVRYMPIRPGDEAGDAALLRRWASFLEGEGRALRALGQSG